MWVVFDIGFIRAYWKRFKLNEGFNVWVQGFGVRGRALMEKNLVRTYDFVVI